MITFILLCIVAILAFGFIGLVTSGLKLIFLACAYVMIGVWLWYAIKWVIDKIKK